MFNTEIDELKESFEINLPKYQLNVSFFTMRTEAICKIPTALMA